MRKKALLIVDDHPVYRDALGEKFSSEFAKWQVPVELAAGTNEGLAILNSGTDYDWVVVLDILLHGLSGEDAIALFRTQAHVKHVVAISGLDESEWKKRAIRSGASAFISIWCDPLTRSFPETETIITSRPARRKTSTIVTASTSSNPSAK